MKGLFSTEQEIGNQLSIEYRMKLVYQFLITYFRASLLEEDNWEPYGEKYYYKKETFNLIHGKMYNRKRKVNSFLNFHIYKNIYGIQLSSDSNGILCLYYDNKTYKHHLRFLFYFKEKWEKLK